MRFLKQLIVYYLYWTSEYAGQTFLSLFKRVFFCIGINLLFITHFIDDELESILPILLFFLGSMSLMLPYLQVLASFKSSDDMLRFTKKTPQAALIFFGLLCWFLVLGIVLTDG